MFKILKKKPIIIFVALSVVGSLSLKLVPMFYNDQTTIKKSQDLNINENYIKDATIESQNTYKNDSNKYMNSFLEEKISSDNYQNKSNFINKQENSKLEKTNNNNVTNKQEIISSKIEETSTKNNANNQVTVSSKTEETSTKNNINNQVTVSSKTEETSTKNNINKQETISQEKTNTKNNTSKQETATSKIEEASIKNDANDKTTTNSKINDVNTENQSSNAEISTFHYDRTTSIYANDNITLLRVEYYVNNKLTYYSVIEKFDAATKSYIEKIYQCNRQTNIDPLIRTDIYTNGNLTKSY